MRQSFGSSARQASYEDTIQNLKIGKDTRVIFQGFTGSVSLISCLFLARCSIHYDTGQMTLMLMST